MNFSDEVDVRFVVFTSDDYLSYIKLRRENYDELKKYKKCFCISPLTHNEFNEKLRRMEELKEEKFYFVQTNELLIGYFVSKTIKKVMFIEELYVRKSYRLKDIGKSIILFLENEGLAEQIRLISVFVDFVNNDAMKFLQKCGFENVKTMTPIEKFNFSKRIL